MKLTKESLEELYSSMSIDEMASHLDMAKSTLYYHMRKLGVERRSRSDAQRFHLKTSEHQRTGKSHTDEAKARIADGTKKYWESSEGEEQKERLGELRREEWSKRSARDRNKVLARLQSAARPEPGQLSKFGDKLADFLSDREQLKTGIRLTPRHVSDIILEERKVVIELILPVAVYGEEQEQKIETRYDRLIAELNDAGYRVVVIQDKSNSLSNARCQRVYDQLLEFFETDEGRLTLVS